MTFAKVMVILSKAAKVCLTMSSCDGPSPPETISVKLARTRTAVLTLMEIANVQFAMVNFQFSIVEEHLRKTRISFSSKLAALGQHHEGPFRFGQLGAQLLDRVGL